MNNAYLILLLSVILLIGCSAIDPHEAEYIAKNFVAGNVKFFSIDGQQQVNHTTYDILILQSVRQGNRWTVYLHVTATSYNDSKQKNLVVVVDNHRNVVEFNGQKLPG